MRSCAERAAHATYLLVMWWMNLAEKNSSTNRDLVAISWLSLASQLSTGWVSRDPDALGRFGSRERSRALWSVVKALRLSGVASSRRSPTEAETRHLSHVAIVLHAVLYIHCIHIQINR